MFFKDIFMFIGLYDDNAILSVDFLIVFFEIVYIYSLHGAIRHDTLMALFFDTAVIGFILKDLFFFTLGIYDWHFYKLMYNKKFYGYLIPCLVILKIFSLLYTIKFLISLYLSWKNKQNIERNK